ncbi:17130_t:CDS:1 [Acaulospora morrowiae]|uniref:17130_t:CDS:1 n=1 Tax=Acaulospora morrowiae TaxID=94023 RepID=A0A9N9H9M7_9GLOM|nr:17130_t:CDS:1 [Acaulospora morrowiae]
MNSFEDLPCECILEIFLYFEDNYSTLYKCLLVSRYWCKLVVPILWRNPFHYWRSSSSRPGENRIENNWHLLRITYIATLNEVEKETLHQYDRRYNHSQPLFQYSSYLEKFSFADIAKIIVEGWKRRDKSANLFTKIRIERLGRIMTAIFQLVLRTGCLREIEILDYYDEKFTYVILNVISFFSYQPIFSQLRNLTINIRQGPYLKELLRNSSKLFTNLERLEYKFETTCSIDPRTVNSFADIITAQSNLKYFSMEIHGIDYQRRFMSHLDSQKESLTSLNLQFVNFSIISLNSIAKFTKLETMELHNCIWITKGNCEMFMKSPIQLKSLTFDTHYFDDTLLATLIEKAGKNLLNLYIDKITEKVVMSLSQFCPNISKFTLCYKLQDYSMFMDYLKGSRISQLVINSCRVSIGSLNFLAKCVPSSLEEIYLCCHFRPEFLGKFLLDYSDLSFNTLRTLGIKDPYGYSYEYLKVIERHSVYNGLKTIVIETTVYIDESSDLIQNIIKKGINILLQELF